MTDFGDGDLKGWQGNGFYIARKPNETEDKCADRPYQEAKAYGEAHPSLLMPRGVLMIHMDREHIPHVKPEPVPDRAATAQSPDPKVVAKQSPPKPQPPRITTIKEVEGEYGFFRVAGHR